MKKRIFCMIISAVMVLSMTFLTSCDVVKDLIGAGEDDIGESNGEIPFQYATNEKGETVQIRVLSQTATKNEEFMDDMVSWYDNEYNYYVFDIGKIKNVPLTPAYAVFVYTGAEMKFEREIEKSTTQTLQTSTATAITSMVKTSFSGTSTVSGGISAKLSDAVSANVQKGYSMTITNEASDQSMWSESYSSCQSFSESETNKVSLTFNSDCRHGNYQYLYLGNITVFYAVVQSRQTGEFYTQTYNKIDSYKYVLNYTGEDDEFPINKKEKIEIDTGFIDDLPEPDTFIESAKPEASFDPITQSWYLEESFDVNLWDFKMPVKGWYWEGFEYYYAMGYDKIDVSFEYHAKSTANIFGDTANIMGYVTTDDKNLDSSLYNYEKEPSKKGSWINGSFTTDLKHFKDKNKICMVFDTENYTETYTISKLTVTIRIYKSN